MDNKEILKHCTPPSTMLRRDAIKFMGISPIAVSKDVSGKVQHQRYLWHSKSLDGCGGHLTFTC